MRCKGISVVALVALVALTAAALILAGCGAGTPVAAEQKAQCFANESLIQDEMKLFNEDSGMYPPLKDVLDKMQLKCPSGGTYSFDATTGVVTCSIHGHP
jgi:hypothetical protein